MSTIVPKMSTKRKNTGLASALFGKTRRVILSMLYSNTDEKFYLRQIIRAAGVGLGAVQREVKNLTDAGIILRSIQGRQAYYQANPECPLFTELKSLVVKTVGIGDILRSALSPLDNRIDLAFIYGSFARGEDKKGSDVDVMIVGDVTFNEIISAIQPAQNKLGREVNPTIYPPDEYKSKVEQNHHFLKSVLGEEKIFIIGDEHELKRLAK